MVLSNEFTRVLNARPRRQLYAKLLVQLAEDGAMHRHGSLVVVGAGRSAAVDLDVFELGARVLRQRQRRLQRLALRVWK